VVVQVWIEREIWDVAAAPARTVSSHKNPGRFAQKKSHGI
jgi:hypothetical protein